MVQAGFRNAFARLLLASVGVVQLGCQPEVAAVLPALESDEVAGSSYAATVLSTPGLLAYFRFSEPSGSIAKDRVIGYSLVTESATVLGGEGAIPSDPEKGEALFDGDASSRFGMPFPEAFGVRSRERSLELWLKPAGTPPSCRQAAQPAAKLLWVQGIVGPFWGLSLTGDDSDALTFQVQVDLETYDIFDAVTPPGTLRLPRQTDCTGAAWQHVVASVDLNAEQGPLKVYVDGKLAAENGLHPLMAEYVPAEAAVAGLEIEPRFEVGGSLPVADDGTATSGEPFLGALDEIAVYSRALEPSEVREHYAAATR